jgi:DNA-directed RNA polymerase subunit RPC12/RpoP
MTQYTLLKGRLKGTQKRKLSQLLDMLYTPAEIADLLGFGKRQFYRVYIPRGCPHQREENGHLWINGAAFRRWYLEQYPKITLSENEAYCLACKKIVPMTNPEIKQKGSYIYRASTCPNCGHGLSKAHTNKRGEDDQSTKQVTG